MEAFEIFFKVKLYQNEKKDQTCIKALMKIEELCTNYSMLK